MLIFKIATLVLAAFSVVLFFVTIVLFKKTLSSLAKAEQPRSSSRSASETAFVRKIEEEYVLIPRSEAEFLLLRAITTANAAGYKVTNRLDKADLGLIPPPESVSPDELVLKPELESALQPA